MNGLVFIGNERNGTVGFDVQDLIFCKDCKYFIHNYVTKIDNVPLITEHEICRRWGDGCKTSEHGWCFLAEKKK